MYGELDYRYESSYYHLYLFDHVASKMRKLVKGQMIILSDGRVMSHLPEHITTTSQDPRFCELACMGVMFELSVETVLWQDAAIFVL